MTSHPVHLQGGRVSVRERSTSVQRIAVGFDGSEAGRDASYLATMVARATGAEVTLITVLPDPAAEIPSMNRADMQESAAMTLRELRDFMPAGARTLLETDWSVPEALGRVTSREEQDLLVVGSSPRGRPGRVRISRRTRQLLGEAACPVAVAPWGLCAEEQRKLLKIGVGYDGRAQARDALALAASLARSAGAQLMLRGAVEDRLPFRGPTPRHSALYAERAGVQEMWNEALEPDVESLRKDAEDAAEATGAEVTVEVKAGSPPKELIALSAEVDLLVVGARTRGPGRALGRTGEELMHDARCSVILVAHPAS
jgi:nucleotide-binding universal stress UspA family protein